MLNRERLKKIGIDIVGLLLIILAGLTGWLPGPGGIPLLVLGLSLLATNHEWAARLMERVKHGGGKFSKRLFSNYEPTRWLIDILSVGFIALAVVLLMSFTRNIAKSAAISLFCASIFLALGNRHRLETLKKRLNRQKP
jgi:hypothetical protein